MKGNRLSYPDKASRIGFVQILTLSRAPEIGVIIKGQWLFFYKKYGCILLLGFI